MPLRSAPSGRESEMGGRDSKKGGRQNGFCRPPLWICNCGNAALHYSWSGVRPVFISTLVTLASTRPIWGIVTFWVIGYRMP